MLIAAWPAHAAIAVVNAASCTAAVTDTCTTGAITSTTGNLFVASVMSYNVSTFVSVTDSKSNTYTDSVAEVENHHMALRQQIKVNGAGGSSHTFTFTGAASNYGSLAVLEVSGATATPFDQSAIGGNTAVTSHTSGSTATTSQANELLIGWGATPNTSTYINDSGAGWTERANIEADGFSLGIICSSKVVSATSTYAYTFTTGSAVDSGAGIGTYKELAVSATRQRCIGCGTDKKVISP